MCCGEVQLHVCDAQMTISADFLIHSLVASMASNNGLLLRCKSSTAGLNIYVHTIMLSTSRWSSEAASQLFSRRIVTSARYFHSPPHSYKSSSISHMRRDSKASARLYQINRRVHSTPQLSQQIKGSSGGTNMSSDKARAHNNQDFKLSELFNVSNKVALIVSGSQ